MTSRRMHRNEAVRLLRIAQGGTVVVALVAFTVLAVDLPGAGRPNEAPPTVMPVTLPQPPQQAGESAAFRIDPRDLSESFALLANAPQQTPPASGGEAGEEAGEKGEASPEQQKEVDTEIRFVASITGGGVEVAIVRVGENQVWLSKGREIEGVKLIEVEPESATIEFQGQRRRLLPGERFGPAISFVGGGGVQSFMPRDQAGSASSAYEGGRPGTTRRPGVTEPGATDEELEREAESSGTDSETLRRERARQSAQELRRRQQEQRERMRRTRETGSN